VGGDRARDPGIGHGVEQGVLIAAGRDPDLQNNLIF
jgi:hypothetical protein